MTRSYSERKYDQAIKKWSKKEKDFSIFEKVLKSCYFV